MLDRSFLFWDFDGVIKESVAVKTEAYERLFARFGASVGERVREHHERNGGMSRFEKLPLYLEWAGQVVSAEAVERYSSLFAEAVVDAVIRSEWVPGVRAYLSANYTRQKFVVVTATPQAEIEQILQALDIREWFCEVHGAPAPKADAMRDVLARWSCPCADALMIGDSDSDYRAALAAGVPFLLRRTPLNLVLQQTYEGPQCKDFLDE